MLFFLAILAIALSLPLGYLFYSRKYKNNTHTQLPQTELEDQKSFSLEELSQYNGINNPNVYVAIKDIVFDVSISPKYKPGASYAAFAGKDITVALAKMSFDEQYFNAFQKVKLTKAEMETMEGWYNYLKERYQVVGQVKSSKRDA